MRQSAVVFDLDDTLYLEREFAHSGFFAVGEYCRAEFGFDDFAGRAIENFEAGERGKIFNTILTNYGVVPEPATIAKLIEVYRNHNPQISLLEDARDCLQKLYGKVPLALITDGPSSMQWNKIRALGIESMLDCIVVTGDLGSEFMKPHPRAFQMVESELGKQGEHLMYVADNPNKDFQAPKQLGWKTLRVKRAGGIYSGISAFDGVDRELRDLSEFPFEWIQRYLGSTA